MSAGTLQLRSGLSSIRSSSKSPCIIERLETRQLLTNTLQVSVPVSVVEISAKDNQNLPINMLLHQTPGILMLTGNNLAEQTSGNKIDITGNVTDVSATLGNTTSASSFIVSSKAKDVMLDSLTTTNPMKLLDLRPLPVNGNVQLMFVPRTVFFGDGMNSTFSVYQNIPMANFSGGSFTNSQFNFTSGTATAPNLNLKYNNLTDTHFNIAPDIKTFSARSFLESSPGSAGISANSGKSFSFATDYKADFSLKGTLGLKYTLDNFRVGGTASGNWNVPGATRGISAKLYDSGFNGTFGSLGGMGASKDFDGILTTGSLGIGSIGGNMNGATINLTNPFAANQWNLQTLKVGNSINNSTITSNGNMESIATMFAFGSRITAGMSSNFQFGQPLNSSSYASLSDIKSVVIDCPSHHKIHFVDSVVGAYWLSGVHLGNIQTDNFGTPFGLAGFQYTNLSFLDNGKTLSFKKLNAIADFISALQKQGFTQSQLGDFSVQLPM